MKTFSLLLVLATLQTAIFAQYKMDGEPVQTKSLSIENISEMSVHTWGGNITVLGSAASAARVEMFATPNNDKNILSLEAIKQQLDEKYDVEISVAGNKLTVMARPKEKRNDWKTSLSISFKIYVPGDITTDLVTSGGSINLKNIAGTLNFKTSGGSLNLDGISGKVNGKTSGGSITIKNSKNDIKLSTSGGSIEAINCKGNLLLSTSGGSINLNELEGEINAVTSGGNIKANKIEGMLLAATSGGNVDLQDLSCSLETSTNGGNINVSLTRLGKYVKIENYSGNVNVTLPKKQGVDLSLNGRIENRELENFNGMIDKYKVKGQLNGGGIPVTVEAGAGSVYFEQK